MKILLVILPVLGFAGGVGIAQALAVLANSEPASETTEAKPTEIFKLQKQFVVPIFENARVNALLLASFNFQIYSDQRQTMFDNDALIKDAILNTLFSFSYGGGFDEVFISDQNLEELKTNLLAALKAPTDGAVKQILIEDMVRQDLR